MRRRNTDLQARVNGNLALEFGEVNLTSERLQALNAAVIASVIPGPRLHTVTVDVDGVVVSTGLQVQRASRGFNPHHRKVPSHGPIMAHLVETTHVVRVKTRSGHVHDGKASLTFLRDLWAQLTTSVTRGAQRRFRMDGAFVRQDVLDWLTVRGAGYAIKVPFSRWLDLQQDIRAQPTWTRVPPEVWGFVVRAAAAPWGHPIRVAIDRTKVAHRTAKTFQLDLFDPNDGHDEYSAVTSNLEFTVATLWYFMAGRGNHKETIAQLKAGLAFHTVLTMAYGANRAWQQLVVLTHNLLTNFQIGLLRSRCGGPPRAPRRPPPLHPPPVRTISRQPGSLSRRDGAASCASRGSFSRAALTRPSLPALVEDADAALRGRLREVLALLYDEIRAVEHRTALLERRLKTFVTTDPVAQHLLTIPGVGLLTEAALLGTVGHIHGFRRGRHFASWLGLTPREHSSCQPASPRPHHQARTRRTSTGRS